MSVEYTWTWGPMKVEPKDGFNDAVTGVWFVCLANDTSSDPNIHGKVSGLFTVPSVDPNSYIPLTELTTDIVNNWIDNYFDKSLWEQKALAYLETQLTNSTKIIPIP